MFFFFFKQKTAYEMRISDWSSDVCSSDLQRCARSCVKLSSQRLLLTRSHFVFPADRILDVGPDPCRFGIGAGQLSNEFGHRRVGVVVALAKDRKSGVSGKSVSGRVDLGGRRIFQKKKKKTKQSSTH